MSHDAKRPSRRAFLRGAGNALIALPTAQFCLGRSGFGDVLAAPGDPTAPMGQRLITFYFPNGCQGEEWNYGSVLTPLADMKDKLVVFNGIDNPLTPASGRDPHEQGAAALFTGALLKSGNHGTGISIDQWLSRRIDMGTTLQKPLVAGVWRGYAGGEFRSPTWFTRSWLEDGSIVTPTIMPQDIFKLLFGAGQNQAQQTQEMLRQKSILDRVLAQHSSLLGSASPLPASHKLLLQDYTDRLRDVEVRVTKFAMASAQTCALPANPAAFKFDGGGLLDYGDFDEVFHLQMDLLVLALQCGVTNTGSLMFCCAGEEYQNPDVSGASDHGTSHYSDEGGHQVYLAYRKYHMTNLRYLLDKLKAANLLDSTVVIAGSEFGDGRSHQVDPQPHLIAGGGGTLKVGQVFDGGNKVTNCDIYRTVLSGLGYQMDSFGNKSFNTGLIKQILA